MYAGFNDEYFKEENFQTGGNWNDIAKVILFLIT